MKTFKEYVTRDITNPYNQYRDGSYLLGPGMGQYVPIANLNLRAQKEKEVKKSDIDQLERYADRLFASLGIDVEFTKHFLDRVNDERNKKQISPAELVRLFNKTYQKHGKTIARLGPDAQAVVKDSKYKELFGDRASTILSVYEHDHDHTHSPDGTIETKK